MPRSICIMFWSRDSIYRIDQWGWHQTPWAQTSGEGRTLANIFQRGLSIAGFLPSQWKTCRWHLAFWVSQSSCVKHRQCAGGGREHWNPGMVSDTWIWSWSDDVTVVGYKLYNTSSHLGGKWVRKAGIGSYSQKEKFSFGQTQKFPKREITLSQKVYGIFPYGNLWRKLPYHIYHIHVFV